MTRDDVIRLAREAEATVFLSPYYIETLERFAAIVAAEEREACAKVAIATGEALTERFGVSAECISTGEEIAAAIRAGGEKP